MLFSTMKIRVYEIYGAMAHKNCIPVGPRCNVIVANLQQVNDILLVAEE